jgi:hypothetical protein
MQELETKAKAGAELQSMARETWIELFRVLRVKVK